MADTHEPQERGCPSCAGKGEVVQPIQVWDHREGGYTQVWRADMCQPCAGTGKVRY